MVTCLDDKLKKGSLDLDKKVAEWDLMKRKRFRNSGVTYQDLEYTGNLSSNGVILSILLSEKITEESLVGDRVRSPSTFNISRDDFISDYSFFKGLFDLENSDMDVFWSSYDTRYIARSEYDSIFHIAMKMPYIRGILGIGNKNHFL